MRCPRASSTCLPAPRTCSNTATFSPMLPPGTMPLPPHKPAAENERERGRGGDNSNASEQTPKADGTARGRRASHKCVQCLETLLPCCIAVLSCPRMFWLPKSPCATTTTPSPPLDPFSRLAPLVTPHSLPHLTPCVCDQVATHNPASPLPTTTTTPYYLSTPSLGFQHPIPPSPDTMFATRLPYRFGVTMTSNW